MTGLNAFLPDSYLIAPAMFGAIQGGISSPDQVVLIFYLLQLNYSKAG